MNTKIVAIDYKGKHFILCDENDVDDMDFLDPYINVDFTLENDDMLKNHVAACLYYGIPAYIGNNEGLKNKIDKFYEELEGEI